MAITLRSTKGAALTHVEMDTNLTSYYVSSSLDGTILNLFSHGTGSYSATTHSIDLIGFLDDTDTNTTYSISAETTTGGANVRLTDSGAGTDDIKLASGTNVTVTRTDANTITISSAHPTISAASSVDNTGRTYIQDITLDSNGHVIGLTSATETVVDTDTTYTAGSGLSLVGTEFSNAEPDQIVSIAGENITVNGTYPNFQITGSVNTDTTYTAGTGLSLVGTEFSNTSPDQTVTLEGQNITVNGTYPNFSITGSDQSTDVTLVTTAHDYLSISGQAITLGAIDLTTDVTGILPAANISAIALTSVQTAADQAAMLALTTQEGDVVVRTDESKTYMHNGGTAGDMTDFTELSTPQNYTHPTQTVTANTSTATPAHGDDFTVIDSVSVNTTGHVTAINTKTITLPADLNTNTTYSISAETVTGGANVRLTAGGDGSGTDDVAIKGSGATTVTRTDANTITISSTDTNTTYTAGNGLGLTGTAFSLDTPGTLTKVSTNGVTANSHTHAITTTTSGTANTIVATDASGEITAVNFVTTSDRRLKSEIEPIKDGLDVVRDIIAFEYIKNGQKEAGFIAQDVQEVLPYAVREGEDGYLKMTDRAILAHLHKAVQQLDERLSAIEEKLG